MAFAACRLPALVGIIFFLRPTTVLNCPGRQEQICSKRRCAKLFLHRTVGSASRDGAVSGTRRRAQATDLRENREQI